MTGTVILQWGLLLILLVVTVIAFVSSVTEGRDDELERLIRSQKHREKEVEKGSNEPLKMPRTGASVNKVGCIIFIVAVIAIISVGIGIVEGLRSYESQMSVEDEDTVYEEEWDEDEDAIYEDEYYENGNLKSSWMLEAKSRKPYSHIEYYEDGNPYRMFYYADGELVMYELYVPMNVDEQKDKWLVAEFDENNELSYLQYMNVIDGECEYEDLDMESADSFVIEYDENDYASDMTIDE